MFSGWGQSHHPTRIIDNVPLRFDAPQEEEFAVANISPIPSSTCSPCPARLRTFLGARPIPRPAGNRAGGVGPQCYATALRKATLRSGGKRLALKNPAHSGRIPAILDLFPDAKFVFLARNPYDVFLSTRRLWLSVMPRSQVQEIQPEQVDAYILRFYSQLMKQYLADRALIPEGNLVEMRFEDLEAEPLAQLSLVYETLGLPGFSEAESAFGAYLQSVAGYQKNRYDLNGSVIATVNQHWRFAFEEWGLYSA